MNEDQIVTNEDFKEYVQAVTESMEKFGEIILQLSNRVKNLESKLNTLERVTGNIALK
jgi:uncharacterized protein (DUF1330 family)